MKNSWKQEKSGWRRWKWFWRTWKCSSKRKWVSWRSRWVTDASFGRPGSWWGRQDPREPCVLRKCWGGERRAGGEGRERPCCPVRSAWCPGSEVWASVETLLYTGANVVYLERPGPWVPSSSLSVQAARARPLLPICVAPALPAPPPFSLVCPQVLTFLPSRQALGDPGTHQSLLAKPQSQ